MKTGITALSRPLTRAFTLTFLFLSFATTSFATFTLDSTFASVGRLTITFPDSVAGYSSRGLRIFVQPGGRILAAGSFTRGTPDGQLPGVIVAGLLSGGTVDSSYANVPEWQSNGFTSLADSLMYSDGRVLRLTNFFNVVGSSTVRAARLNADGTTDSAFSSNASIGAQGGFGTAKPSQILVRPDGKILVLIRENGEFFLYRLNIDGTRDTAFGVNGVVGIVFNKISSPSEAGLKMLALNDGKILIAGNVPPVNFPAGSEEFFLARLSESGNWDKTFGRVGFVKMAFGPGLTGRIQDAVLQPDGKVILCGSVSNSDMDTWMMRFRSNGRVDSLFGSAGVVVNDFAPGGSDAAAALAVSPDGKIRIAGSIGTPENFLVARFSSSGVLEDNISFPFTPGQYALAYDVTLQPDGKLLVIGETKNPDTATGSVFAIARLTE